MSRAIELFVADLEAAKKSPATIHGYRSDLQKFAKQLRRDTVLDVTPEAIREAMRMWSSYDLAQNTLFRRQTAIRTFCKWGRKQQRFWLENPADLVDAIPQAPRLPRPFEPEEAARLWTLELPAVEDLGRALLFFTGLRVTSICTLSVGSVSGDMRQLRAVGKKGYRYTRLSKRWYDAACSIPCAASSRPSSRPSSGFTRCGLSGFRSVERWRQSC